MDIQVFPERNGNAHYKDFHGLGSALPEVKGSEDTLTVEEAKDWGLFVYGFWVSGVRYPQFVRVDCRGEKIGSFDVRRRPIRNEENEDKLGYELYIDKIPFGGNCAGPRSVSITLGKIWLS